jgi:hypothetical protein
MTKIAVVGRITSTPKDVCILIPKPTCEYIRLQRDFADGIKLIFRWAGYPGGPNVIARVRGRHKDRSRGSMMKCEKRPTGHELRNMGSW